MTSDKKNFLLLSLDQIQREMVAMNIPKFRASQLMDAVYKQGLDDVSQVKQLPIELRDRLKSRWDFVRPEVRTHTSVDGTIKYTFQFTDGALAEAVWMPSEDRNSLCISSQAGCAMNCAFCVTGTLGLKRNLSAAEILTQVWYVKCREQKPVSNIVYMGMGEPLHNLEQVLVSLEHLTDPQRLAVGKRKITVSTVGLAQRIPEFLQQTDIKLAISLTGSTNEDRNHWMPVNKAFPLEKLKEALKSYKLGAGRKYTFEVVLIGGQTDREEDAQNLAKFLVGLPAKVNLIPYNENPFFPHLKSPTQASVAKYRELLKQRGFHSTVRRNRGRDIMGACGQLVGTKENKQ